jgi:hypothetical protein
MTGNEGKEDGKRVQLTTRSGSGANYALFKTPLERNNGSPVWDTMFSIDLGEIYICIYIHVYICIYEYLSLVYFYTKLEFNCAYFHTFF